MYAKNYISIRERGKKRIACVYNIQFALKEIVFGRLKPKFKTYCDTLLLIPHFDLAGQFYSLGKKTHHVPFELRFRISLLTLWFLSEFL